VILFVKVNEMTIKSRNNYKNVIAKKMAAFMVPLLGALMGLLVGAILLIMQGVNPIVAYYALLQGSLIGWPSISETLLKASPLVLAGLAVCYSYRTGFFNIGAEGQLYMGAVGATIIGTNFAFLPSMIHIPLAIIVGALFGGILAVIPGLLRAYRGVNEIVTTILFNYVAAYFLSMLVQGPLKEPGSFYPRSLPIVESALLPKFPASPLHTGIFFVILLAGILYWLFNKTTYGFAMEVAGGNHNALHYAGVNLKKMIVQVMLVSGMIAGTAGVIEILGVHKRLIENFSVGLGYEAIAVALLANLNPLGALLSGTFFGALKTGASSMQIATGVPVSFISMIQALIILFVIAFTVFPRILIRINKRRMRKNA